MQSMHGTTNIYPQIYITYLTNTYVLSYSADKNVSLVITRNSFLSVAPITFLCGL